VKVNTPPYNDEFVDDTKRMISYKWANFFSVFLNEINNYLGDLGYIFPSIKNSTTQDSTIQQNYKRSIVYDSDNTQLLLNNTGTYQPIATIQTRTTSEIQEEAILPENVGRIFVNSDTSELQFSIDSQTVRTIVST